MKRYAAGGSALSAKVSDCWNHIGVRGDSSCQELAKHVHCRNCPVYGRAAAMLLDAELPPGYIAESTEHFSLKKNLAGQLTRAVLVFRIGCEWLALPTSACSEVIDMRTIHTLPHRQSDVLRGLASVRGELLVCVSIGNLLGIERAQKDIGRREQAYSRLIVIRGEGGRMVFPVNEVQGVLRYRDDELADIPATLSRAAASYTTAALRCGEKTIGCLDDQLLFYVLNRSLA